MEVGFFGKPHKKAAESRISGRRVENRLLPDKVNQEVSKVSCQLKRRSFQ
jgi:hypothetical protein